MAGIQISGLLSNQAFDWKPVVDQLIAACSASLIKLDVSKNPNNQKSGAHVGGPSVYLRDGRACIVRNMAKRCFFRQLARLSQNGYQTWLAAFIFPVLYETGKEEGDATQENQRGCERLRCR